MTCPHCYANDDSMGCATLQWESGYCWVSKWGLEREEKHLGELVEEEYWCKTCNRMITTDYAEAEAILMEEGPWNPFMV